MAQRILEKYDSVRLVAKALPGKYAQRLLDQVNTFSSQMPLPACRVASGAISQNAGGLHQRWGRCTTRLCHCKSLDQEYPQHC